MLDALRLHLGGDRTERLVIVAAAFCAITAQLLQIVSPYSNVVSAGTVAIGSLRCLLYIAAGLIIRRQRPGNIVGPILIAAGFATWIPTIEFIPNALPWTLSNAFRLASLPIAAHLYVAFPGTRPLRGFDRRLVLFTYGFWFISSIVALAFFDSASPAVCVGCPPNLLLIYPDEQLHRFFGAVADGAGIALAIVVGWRVRVHWATGTPALRRAMVPALVAVPLVLVDVTVYLFGDALRAGLLTDVLSGPVGQLLRLVPPLAFLAGVLRTQLDQSAVSRLLVDFGRSPTLADMEDALSRTLHDNSIQLYGWSAGARTWVDDRGVVQTLPKPTESVGVTIVDSDGDPLAALIHDPAIWDEATLLSAATAALRLTLDNKRLLVSVGTQAAQAGNMPRGRVTFLYADIEGSTGLLAALGDDYTDLLLEERRLIRQIVRDHHGFEVDARADEFLAVFVSAAEAAAAATGDRSPPPNPGVAARLRGARPDRSPHGRAGVDERRLRGPRRPSCGTDRQRRARRAGRRVG